MKLKEIKTDRLTLREMDADSWKDYVSHVTDADEIFVQYGCEPTEEFLDEIQEPTPGVIYYSIRMTDTDQRVGYIGILEENDNIEYHIYQEHRNHHYCTEALRAFLRAYLSGEMTGDKHDSVVADTFLENDPSCCVLENAGFKKDGAGFCFSLNPKTNSLSLDAVRVKYIYRED